MTQSEFSILSKKFIAENYPAFLNTIVYHENDSFDCSLKSRNGKLYIWIATYDCEITVGFDNAEKQCVWHTHMSLVGANNTSEELIALSELLDSIFSGEQQIVFSSKMGISLTNSIESEIGDKDEDETILLYNWNELLIPSPKIDTL